MRLLLIEDEAALREMLKGALEASGYEVDACAEGPEGLEYARLAAHDLILLDRMLPGLDGVSLLKTLRREGVATPVLMLTAMNAVGDEVDGLDAGADDYLPKPFSMDILLARIRALLRRPAAVAAAVLACGDVELHEADKRLVGPKGAASLSPREAALLAQLLRAEGRALPRETLLLRVWGPDSEVGDGNLGNYILLVRRRLATVGSALQVQTVRGTGYRLEAGGC